MNVKAAVVLLSGMLFACAPTPPPAAQPPPAAPAATEEPAKEHHIVTIRTVNCEALLKLSEEAGCKLPGGPGTHLEVGKVFSASESS